MHRSAYKTSSDFFKTYCTNEKELSVVEIGSQNVNGTLRDLIPSNVKNYVGVDFVEGKGVDVILDDPYKFPFEDNTFDVLVSSSCFEHSEMFWLVFLECIRIIKPNGVIYLNAPAIFCYHKFPVDCWRFFPDSGKALETWAKYNQYNTKLLESYLVPCVDPHEQGWFDWTAVYVKNGIHIDEYPNRMLDALNANIDYVHEYKI